jgi:predicted esterase
MAEVRDFRVLIGHGIANAQVPIAMARRAFRALYAAGADVRFLTYPATHRLHARMLRDMNHWVIDRINAENDQLIID